MWAISPTPSRRPSAIVNEATARADDPLGCKVTEQTDIMRDQVAHHLERARIAARIAIVGTVTEVAPGVKALGGPWRRSAGTMATPSAVEADTRAKSPASARAWRRWPAIWSTRLQKWAASRVLIEVLVEPPAEPGSRANGSVSPSMTMAGISPPSPQVARRGRRLDERGRARAWPLDRGRTRRPLRRRPLARRLPDRRLAGRTGAAGRVSARPVLRRFRPEPAIPCSDSVNPKRLLNALTLRSQEAEALCRPRDTTVYAHQAHEPDIERAAEGLSSTSSRRRRRRC